MSREQDSAVSLDTSTPDVDVARELQVRVTSIRRAAEDVLALELVDVAGSALPPWSPGAHVDLTLPSGLVRQYSLCGSPGDLRSYRIAVLREPAGRASRELHDGRLSDVRMSAFGPKNHFRLEPAESYLFLAGGIGITPILPMAAAVARTGLPWRLVYGGRSRATMAFLDELDESGESTVDIVPEVDRGRLDLANILASADPGTAVYVCGPPAMLAAVDEVAASLPLPPGRIRIERFAASGAAAPVPDGDHAFEVELRRTGVVVEIPCGRSILEVVREVCPDVHASCEEGFCGTCETPVLGGVPDHRDEILTDREKAAGKTMMICVGRAKSERLILDL